jgi:hypothetical protein
MVVKWEVARLSSLGDHEALAARGHSSMWGAGVLEHDARTPLCSKPSACNRLIPQLRLSFHSQPRGLTTTMADAIPTKLKGLQLAPFAKRAAQLEKFKPIVTYWCMY